MNKQRLGILIASGLGALATFLPWATVTTFVGSQSINGTAGDGLITLILFAVPIVITLLNDKTKRLEGKLLYGAIVASSLAGLIGLWKISDLSSLGNLVPGAEVSSGFGLYLLILASIAVVISAFLIKDEDTSE